MYLRCSPPLASMKKIVVVFLTFVLLGCTIQSNRVNDLKSKISRDAYMASLDSTELMDGMIFWTSDTAFSANPELMILLDTLYRHVRTDSFPSDVETELHWMKEYRSLLCALYDANPLGSDSISCFAKADSVLNEGVRLLELGNHWSTMDVVVYNSTIYTFDRFREYNLLSQVLSNCENVEAINLLLQEWALYERMLEKMDPIASNMVCFNYWGGSICGPLGTAAYLGISSSRQEMYKRMLDIMTADGWEDMGVNLINAERFLFDCCNTSIGRIVKESDEFYSEYEGKEPSAGFNESINETKLMIKELRSIVHEWVDLIDKVDEELTYDGSRYSIERAASYMLMRWASIVTER